MLLYVNIKLFILRKYILHVQPKMTMTVQSSLIQVLINRETPFNSFRCKQTILFDIKGPASDDVSNIFSTDLLEVKKNEDMYCNRSVFNRATLASARPNLCCRYRELLFNTPLVLRISRPVNPMFPVDLHFGASSL